MTIAEINEDKTSEPQDGEPKSIWGGTFTSSALRHIVGEVITGGNQRGVQSTNEGLISPRDVPTEPEDDYNRAAR